VLTRTDADTYLYGWHFDGTPIEHFPIPINPGYEGACGTVSSAASATSTVMGLRMWSPATAALAI